MQVVQIGNDTHTCLGIAKDYESALAFLYNNGWIKGSTEVWVDDYTNNEWERLDEVFGEDWFDKMLTWGIENFNKYWGDSFTLKEVEVYEY